MVAVRHIFWTFVLYKLLNRRTLPIALGLGAGAESRRPLGLAVVGGLLVSQLLTLYITPVYYVYIEGARQRMMRRRPAAVEPRVAAAH